MNTRPAALFQGEIPHRRTLRIAGALSAVCFTALAMGAHSEVIEIRSGVRAASLSCPPGIAPKKQPPRPLPPVELAPPEPEILTDLSLDASPVMPVDPVVINPGLPPAFSIAIWGDSHAAARFLSDGLVASMGYGEDDVRPSFIPAAIGIAGVRLPVRQSCADKGWTYQQANAVRNGRMPFARGLVTMSTSTAGSYLWVDFGLGQPGQELASLGLVFRPGASEDRAILAASVDDGPERIIIMDDHPDGFVTLLPDRPMRMLKLRVLAGAVAFEGFEPHYLVPGRLTVDTFGIPGARFRSWRAVDETYLRDRSASRRYDLVLLEYGTNEGSDASFDAGAYEVELRAGLEAFRTVYPDAACVLVGPTDRGVLVKRTRQGHRVGAKVASADLLKYARVHQVIGSVQQRVGSAFGCGFWNWQDAMGGPGGAYRWFHAKPGLMARDLIHLNPAGYRVSAGKLALYLGRTYPELR